ncbi:MAG: efflux RND transporter periplasmic adaptor subunit [Planctomycetales bacterium]|nr:efflux RND transporter periplasmic adaptor subunit [Planctomycetales bacterium]
MPLVCQVEEIDQLLNELDRLAHECGSREQLIRTLLSRLSFLLNANGAGLLAMVDGAHWASLAVVGTLEPTVVATAFAGISDDDCFWVDPASRILAVPLQQKRWSTGALAVALPNLPSPAETREVSSLLSAFAEIANSSRQAAIEQRIDRQSLFLQKTVLQVSNSQSRNEGAHRLVNDLVVALEAERVSLVSGRVGTAHVLAISGVVLRENRSTTLTAIERECRETIAVCKASAKFNDGKEPNAESEQVLFANRICLPIVTQISGDAAVECDTSILIEWSKYGDFLVGCELLHSLSPAITVSWVGLDHATRVPKSLRKLFGIRGSKFTGGLSRHAFRWLIVTAIVLAVTWGVTLPVKLRIEVEGTLQPSEKREIFAPADGVVSEILVADGDSVQAGQPLVQINSPLLEIDIQETLGEIRAVSERRDGLQVAINQLQSFNADFAAQTKISSEIRELEMRLRTLEEKQQALVAERQKLLVVSPITGTVIARQIERALGARPVRRGDALLRIADLEGGWELDLLLADSDAGHVKRQLAESTLHSGGALEGQEASTAMEITYALTSKPDQPLQAQLSWISESARNPRGDGAYLDVIASVSDEAKSLGHMGATVTAYFDCGKAPIWFVWSRSLVESLQRKLWF